MSARERLTRLAARLWRLRLPPLASWLWSRSRLESLTQRHKAYIEKHIAELKT